MTGVSKSDKKPVSTDFRFVLSRLEREIIKGEKTDLCLRYLSKEEIWQKIGSESQLKWARLAQMAGDMETAIKVLAYINSAQPGFQKAWVERLELLFLLGRREEAAQVLAQAKEFNGDKLPMDLHRFSGEAFTQEEDHLEETAAKPFEAYRRRQDGIGRYLTLFSGREDCFARQWVDKSEGKQGYVPVRRPLEPADVEEHLGGRKTYGIYLLDSNACVRTAVIDADLVSEFRGSSLRAEDKNIIKRELPYLMERIRELSKNAGLKPLIELSGGKGYHFWYFFDPPVKAQMAKNILTPIVKMLSGDLTSFHLEVFPKQDRLSGKGLGNLVKLPLGVHRLTGKRSYFLGCHDRSIDSQLNFLSKAKTARLDELSPSNVHSLNDKILVHPRWKNWAEEYPVLARLESHCPPLAQIITLKTRVRATHLTYSVFSQSSIWISLFFYLSFVYQVSFDSLELPPNRSHQKGLLFPTISFRCKSDIKTT